MGVFAVTERLVFSTNTVSIGPALGGITRVDALVSDIFVHVITGVVSLALGVVFASVGLSAYASETYGARRTVECRRTRRPNTTDLVFDAGLPWGLTGVQRITDETGRADALETSDDIHTVGSRSTRISLKAFVDVFTAEEWVSMETGRTNAFNTRRPLQAGGALTADYILTSGH